MRDSTTETATYTADDLTGKVFVAQKATVTFTSPKSPVDLAATLSDTDAGAPSTALSATFTASATGSLVGGAAGTPTITLTAPSWAPLPSPSSAYQVSDAVSGADPVREVTVSGGDKATVVLGDSGITNGDTVTLSVSGLSNPEPAGDYGVTVSTSADTTIGSATATVTPAQPSASTSTTTATPPTVPADGTSASTVTVTERDAFTEPVPGDTVTLHPSAGSHAAVTPPSAKATNTGVVTFSVTDSAVETVAFAPIDTTAGVELHPASVDFTLPAGQSSVSTVAVVPGPPPTTFVAGATTTYDVSFTTSPTGGRNRQHRHAVRSGRHRVAVDTVELPGDRNAGCVRVGERQ